MLKQAIPALLQRFACTLATPLLVLQVHAQQQIDTVRQLTDVIISVNKWELNQNEVPNKITKIRQEEIFRNNPQTAADLLQQTGTVFIQKSQLGGGSPMIRGFATNRVLLVVDGVRMNNAIYRSGNLQNVISIDALALETAEVVFGPGSLIYGSDALGGVMDFHTLQPRLFTDSTKRIKGSALVRWSGANNENTIHGDVNWGNQKWAALSSFTYSKFEDLKMGRWGGQDSYLRPEYVLRFNNRDSIVRNTDPRVQRFTGYEQLNLVNKLRFRPNRYTDLQYSYIHARTGDAPRYDRLIQYRNGQLRFAEWNYGPMIWNMHSIQAQLSKRTALWDEARIIVAGQHYEESRIDRARNNNNRNIQTETVYAGSVNADLNKELAGGTLFYGAEWVGNRVRSAGERINLLTNATSTIPSRYPNGSSWSSSALYISYKKNINRYTTFTGGLRYNFNTLNAVFDTALFRFPFREAQLQKGSLIGNAGVVRRTENDWQFNLNLSTGFRMPNIDDIGKLFESTPGILTVPNPQLQPEYAWNLEGGFIKKESGRYRLEVNLFHTWLNRAIVRRPFTFNGSDSIFFNGMQLGVEALQNAAVATVYGVQLSAEYQLSPTLLLQTHANWISGTETDENSNRQVPLRHAPPFYGSTHLRWNKGRWFAECFTQYNSTITHEKLAPVEQAKREIYALDANGNPFSPGWYTLNLRSSYTWKNQQITLGWENITNQRYRAYASGIVAPGSNLIVSLRATL